MSGKKQKSIKRLKKRLKNLAKRVNSMQKELNALRMGDRGDRDSETVVAGEAHFTEAELEEALEATEDAEEYDELLKKTKH